MDKVKDFIKANKPFFQGLTFGIVLTIIFSFTIHFLQPVILKEECYYEEVESMGGDLESVTLYLFENPERASIGLNWDISDPEIIDKIRAVKVCIYRE